MSDGVPWLYPAFGVRRGFGEHAEHLTHHHESHPGDTRCSCGAVLGLSCFIPPDYDPGPCPRCHRDRRHALSRLADVLEQVAASGRR